MSGDTLAIGRQGLTRATLADLDRLVAFQHAAYAPNRELLGVEPLPLLADYRQVLGKSEVWLLRDREELAAALILEPRPDDLLIWSIATDPARQGGGLGRALLVASQTRARQLGREVVRLYTGAKLTVLIAWYARHGFHVERIETLADRQIAHMIKRLTRPGR